MSRHFLFFLFSAGILPAPLIAGEGASTHLEVLSGAVSFAVATNVPGVDIKGRTSNLTAHVQVEATADGLLLQQMQAVIPVRGLSTGMKLRDEHMQKYIFQTANGQIPDVTFSADSGLCKPSASSHAFACQIPGTLQVRGTSHPVNLNIIAKEEGGSARSFRATLDTTIKLSDFNIEAPSQFGVRPSNDVRLHLEFTAKPKPDAAALLGGGK